MNCKQGDLAVVVGGSPRFLGMIVEVIAPAPLHDFTLPDGYPSVGAGRPGYWIVRSAGRPFQASIQRASGSVGRRAAEYGIWDDMYLRPIRDQDGADETLQWPESLKG